MGIRVGIPTKPQLVAALPSSPVDMQEIYYLADGTNGIVWHLRYRAASASSFKWEFVGGGPLAAYVNNSETQSTAAYTDLSTVGPSITVPFAGDYELDFGASVFHSPTAVATFMSLALGAAAAVDADAAHGDGTAEESVSRNYKKTLAASDNVVAKYKGGSATATFEFRWLKIKPIRVG